MVSIRYVYKGFSSPVYIKATLLHCTLFALLIWLGAYGVFASWLIGIFPACIAVGVEFFVQRHRAPLAFVFVRMDRFGIQYRKRKISWELVDQVIEIDKTLLHRNAQLRLMAYPLGRIYEISYHEEDTAQIDRVLIPVTPATSALLQAVHPVDQRTPYSKQTIPSVYILFLSVLFALLLVLNVIIGIFETSLLRASLPLSVLTIACAITVMERRFYKY